MHQLDVGGRRVAVHEMGDPTAARTVVLCHAAPGSGAFDPDPDQTRARSIRLLAVDRPGYGGSDPVPDGQWATVASAAGDVAAALDQLGVEGPVGVAGWSAGGRVALAVAARHPELVDRVVVMATPAPQEEVPWIPDEQVAGLDAMRALPPEEVHAALGAQVGQMLGEEPSPDALLAMVGAGPGDERALAMHGARDRLVAMLRGAMAQGVGGVTADIAGYCLQPWGFEPREVEAKTLLLYGKLDPVTGPAHARWWKEHLGDRRVEIAPTAGHLLVIPMWGRALSHLAPGTKSST